MNPIFTDPAGAVSPDGPESGGVVAPTMSDPVTVAPRLRHSSSGASRVIRFMVGSPLLSGGVAAGVRPRRTHGTCLCGTRNVEDYAAVPTIMATILCWLSGLGTSSPTLRPRRMTTARSATSVT